MEVYFLGSGGVSNGARKIFDLLPHEYISVDNLPAISKSTVKRSIIYGCVVTPKDYIVGLDFDELFCYEKFKAFPYKYKSIFHEKILPYASCVINGMYWDKKYPKIITKEHLKTMGKSSRLRLLAIGDITCDINGSIECTEFNTTFKEPFYYYDPVTEKVKTNR